MNGSKALEHQGVKVELIGQIGAPLAHTPAARPRWRRPRHSAEAAELPCLQSFCTTEATLTSSPLWSVSSTFPGGYRVPRHFPSSSQTSKSNTSRTTESTCGCGEPPRTNAPTSAHAHNPLGSINEASPCLMRPPTTRAPNVCSSRWSRRLRGRGGREASIRATSQHDVPTPRCCRYFLRVTIMRQYGKVVHEETIRVHVGAFLHRRPWPPLNAVPVARGWERRSESPGAHELPHPDAVSGPPGVVHSVRRARGEQHDQDGGGDRGLPAH